MVAVIFFWLLKKDRKITNIQYFMKIQLYDTFLHFILYKYNILGKLANWKPVTPNQTPFKPKLISCNYWTVLHFNHFKGHGLASPLVRE